jgi:hypothetical protein
LKEQICSKELLAKLQTAEYNAIVMVSKGLLALKVKLHKILGAYVIEEWHNLSEHLQD